MRSVVRLPQTCRSRDLMSVRRRSLLLGFRLCRPPCQGLSFLLCRSPALPMQCVGGARALMAYWGTARSSQVVSSSQAVNAWSARRCQKTSEDGGAVNLGRRHSNHVYSPERVTLVIRDGARYGSETPLGGHSFNRRATSPVKPVASMNRQKVDGQTSPSDGAWPSGPRGPTGSGCLIAGAMIVSHPTTWHLHHRKVFSDDDWLGAGRTNVTARLVTGFTIEDC